MKKRTIAMVVALAILIATLTCSLVSVFSATYVQDEDWKYELPSSNPSEYYLAGYVGTNTRVQIPALFQSKPVTKIVNNAFLNNTNLTYISIPATITSIGMNAFYGCSSLDSIVIPDSVEQIGNNAFYGCSSAEVISISQNTKLTEIPRNCFSGCSMVTEVTIPFGITTISDRAFFDCTSLYDVIIYPSVISISEKAFDGCTSMRILGWNDTYAQQYAQENNIPFISMGDYSYPTEPESSVPASSPDEVLPTESVSSPDSVTVPVSSSANVTESTSAGVKYLIGDSDLSGTVTVKDATHIQKYAADLVVLDKTALFLANCDSKGGVNVKDATQIQKYCAGFKNILFVGTEVVF